MIDNYISYSLKEETKYYSINIIRKRHDSIAFGYPCGSDVYNCTPYVVNFKPGKYRFELWGSSGLGTTDGTPGKGGYTSGEVIFNESQTVYFYIGAHGFYNVIKLEGEEFLPDNYAKPGGASDARLVSTDNWYDNESLISRIMVSAGGGGSEWPHSIGGDGGGLIGGESYIGTRWDMNGTTYNETCPGATQTSGSQCPQFSSIIPKIGYFGYGLAHDEIEDKRENGTDYGGWGGGGYYVGTSYLWAGGGSGGSSFISGHSGCNAVENNSAYIQHTHKPNHYSGIIFDKTIMINGSCEMPLPNSKNYGVYDDSGAFRITLPDYKPTIFSQHSGNQLFICSFAILLMQNIYHKTSKIFL